jgi:hypothetical protein
MANNYQEIKLNYSLSGIKYCSFNRKGELILYKDAKDAKDASITFKKAYESSSINGIILIYSTQIKNNKWKCERTHAIPKNFELLSIPKFDKLYLYSNNSIYEWNLISGESTKILWNEVINCLFKLQTYLKIIMTNYYLLISDLRVYLVKIAQFPVMRNLFVFV